MILDKHFCDNHGLDKHGLDKLLAVWDLGSCLIAGSAGVSKSGQCSVAVP